MSDYEVKNVEAVVVSNDIQVRVFTLAQGDVIPGTITAEADSFEMQWAVPGRIL